ncbi:hypothetical protein [Kordia sp.]|uniref:hypothetical protein n=1 Tax=Kordia sp. TaxID=1965332 RepID=UPI003B5B5B0B
MKKKKLQSLALNKRTISNFKHRELRGGYASDRLNGSCTAGNCGTTAPLPTSKCPLPTEDCTEGFICSSALCAIKSEDFIICLGTRP